MIRPGQLLRLMYINSVLVRHGLDEIIFATHLFRPVRFLLYLLPWNWVRRKRLPRAQRIRCALEDLGPIFVKFGQMLSTRRDLLPDDIAAELAVLQDRVPSFPGVLAQEIVEKSLGRPVAELFQSFSMEALASASIAQVHAAQLFDGREVVVKVVRPGILPVIRRDLGLLYVLADLAARYWKEGRRLRPREVVAEYEKTILDELDMMREAANASQLRRNFTGSSLLYVPEVHWQLTRRNVMVMERITGTPISDIQGLKNKGIDLKKLSERGVEIFFTQVFKHSFFHADMHPGNIFVADDGRYIAVDFGIMGVLSATDQRYLAENFLAFFKRDYRRVAELHVQSGWVPPGTRVEEFEAAIRTVCEPIFEKPLKDISFGQLLLRLFQTARRFNMQIQPQLVLLQKTLLNVEGLGRELYPDLDLWQTGKPLLERWMSERVGVRALLRNFRENLPIWVERAPEIPALLYDALLSAGQDASRRGRESEDESMRRMRQQFSLGQQRLYVGMVGATLMLSAVLLIGFFGYAPLPSWVLGGLGVIFIISAWPRDLR